MALKGLLTSTSELWSGKKKQRLTNAIVLTIAVFASLTITVTTATSVTTSTPTINISNLTYAGNGNVPEKPRNITVLLHTTSLTLTWEKPVREVDQYIVSLNDTVMGNSTTEKFEVTGLLAGTIYKIAIGAVRNGKASQEEVVYAATRPKQVIEIVKAARSDVSSVLLKIFIGEFVPGSLLSVHFQPQDGPKRIQRFPMQPGINAYIVSNLFPGTKYHFIAYTELYGVESEHSHNDAAAADYYTRFAAPQNVSINEATRSTTEVEITWVPYGGFTEFELYCNGAPKVVVKTTMGECTRLTPGTVFTIHVVTLGTVNYERVSSAPSKKLISITIPLPPKTFTASTANATSIHLAWTRNEGSLQKWILNIDPAVSSLEQPISLEDTQTTYDVDGLTPGRLFNFSIIAQSIDPVTNETFDSSLTFVDERTYPGVPKNITILSTSKSSLEVAWDAPNGDVSLYNVTVCPYDSSSPCRPAVIVTGTSANLTDLTPAGLKWKVVVTAMSGGRKESQSSHYIDAFTYPQPLLSLTIDAVNTTSATLTWQHDAGDKAEALLLRWEPQTSMGPMIFTSTSASQVITGLTPGQRYVFFIKAKSGQWNSSEINNATTMEPVGPSNLVTTKTKAHHLAVSWNLTEGLYDSFTVGINPDPTAGSATIDTNTTDAEFSNLLPGTEYDITVFTNAGGRESVNLSHFFNTSEIAPGPPRYLTAVEPVNSRFLIVNWEEPLEKNGWIKRYVLLVHPSSSGSVISVNTSKDETREKRKTIIGLNPATEYTVWVTAFNGAGAGQVSENITVTTRIAVPPLTPTVTGLDKPVGVGTTHILTCDADEPAISDPITYTWYKDNTVKLSGNTLSFNPIVKGDAGTYKCEAENAVGTKESRNTDLEVYYPPDTITLSSTKSTSLPNQQEIITCTTNGGNPQNPTLTIYRDINGSKQQLFNGTGPAVELKGTTMGNGATGAKFYCESSLSGYPMVSKRSNEIMNSYEVGPPVAVIAGVSIACVVLIIMVGVGVLLIKMRKGVTDANRTPVHDNPVFAGAHDKVASNESPVMRLVTRFLPNASNETWNKLVDSFKALGVEGTQDLMFLEVKDLVPPLKVVEARRFLQQLQDHERRGGDDEGIYMNIEPIDDRDPHADASGNPELSTQGNEYASLVQGCMKAPDSNVYAELGGGEGNSSMCT